MRENHETPPPDYTENVAGVSIERPEVGVQARVTGMHFVLPRINCLNEFGRLVILLEDGRIAIDPERQFSIFSPSLKTWIQEQINEIGTESSKPAPPAYVRRSDDDSVRKTQALARHLQPSPLNIVMHVVGSRGDVQPFIALGLVLKTTYKHRVRIATHPIFKSLVETNNLEFFSIGGDPQELMAFMVRSSGLLPSLDILRRGDVAKHRKMVACIMEGCWRACIEEGDGMCDVEQRGKGKRGTAQEASFVADMIVANPPSFAHVHCGQKLGVPVHLMFT
jgi:hypothetical protein